MDLDNRPHFRTSSLGNSSHNTLSTITTNTSATNELFTCFTSRLSSSSSMKLTKSFLSPARSSARDGGGASLSSSISRRLRPNGSLKAAGQASPFFGKRKGCAFENPEPSSPKVTCIGQVRVKTKKKVRSQQSRNLSKREVSFRKIESDGNNQDSHLKAGSAHFVSQECLSHKNQRWVHLPVSICEALRDFSCFFPCSGSNGSSKGSCFGKEKGVEKENTASCGDEKNGCGAVFARWLVSVNDGEHGRSRKIELVVGGGDEDERVLESSARVSMRSSRRHVFEDIEVKDDVIEVKGKSFEDGEESEARVSICIPPKNALLLMRCRSDPVKMAALVNRFSWDAAACDMEDDNEDVTKGKVEGSDEPVGCDGEDGVVERDVEASVVREEILDLIEDKAGDSCVLPEEIQEQQVILCTEDFDEEIEVTVHNSVEGDEEEEVESNMSSFEALLDQENAVEHYEDCPIQEKEQAEDGSPIHHLSSSSIDESDDDEDDSFAESHSVVNISPVVEEATLMQQEKYCETEDSSSADKVTTFTYDIERNPGKISQLEKKDEQETKPVLPECLLLMMCEPKLSMEVSKETWVCSTDFLRWLPERPRRPAKSSNCCHQQQLAIPAPPPTDTKDQKGFTTLLSIEEAGHVKLLPKEPTMPKDHVRDRSRSLQVLRDRSEQYLPKEQAIRGGEKPRSSCTLPAAAAASMAKMIEHKLVNAVGYEPFVLTRCKSEPMRTAAAKLMPHESCFWKNAVRKMEPRATPLGVGATGVGF